jgi:glycerate kinase
VTVAARARTTVLFATDSFKGSLSSVQVGRALAVGWTRVRARDRLLHAPLADGGEGTLEAIAFAGGWSWQETHATDPLGRPLAARWLRSDDGRRAFVELAEASGLSRVAVDDRDPIAASTFGTGEVLHAVIEAGVGDITVGIGGSATTDGGAGILRALGAQAHEEQDGSWSIDLSGVHDRLSAIALRIACDVTNPLLGTRGAAATYGPQKGARPKDVELLDRRLARFADALEAATGRQERDTPGAGAAGGTAFGLLALADRFRSLRLVPGIDVVTEALGFDAKLRRSDLVVTGEGRVDEQTSFGKTALGVAQRAKAAGVPCVAIGGGVTAEGAAALAGLGVPTLAVVDEAITIEAAMAAGAAPVERAGERLARLLDLGALVRTRSTRRQSLRSTTRLTKSDD